jgi:transposase
VTDVSERLGVSAHSLYKWVKAVKPDKTEEQAAALVEARSEVLKLRAKLKRTEGERDILKNRLRGLPRPMQSETGVATLSYVRTEAVSFLEALTPSKNLAQGKLRTQCWWRDSRPRLGM